MICLQTIINNNIMNHHLVASCFYLHHYGSKSSAALTVLVIGMILLNQLQQVEARHRQLIRSQELQEKLAAHPFSQVETVYTSTSGINTARTTGLISSVASLLIIFLIFRSSIKLSSPYHRIVFGMSVADVVASLAIFSSTWLMPTDMIYTQFQSAVLGNWDTCHLQGFLYLIGSQCAFGFNGALCIYYVSIIRYKRTDEKFMKFEEPILVLLCLLIPFGCTIWAAVEDLISPTPYDITCTGAIYPYWCGGTFLALDEEDLQLCAMIPGGRFGGLTGRILSFILFISYVIFTLAIFMSLFLICRTIYVQAKVFERNIINVDRLQNTGNNAANLQLQESKIYWSETRTVFRQALGYILAFLVCQLFPFFSIISRERGEVLQYLHVILRPLQGLFNLCIFLGHKMYNQKRSNNHLTRWQAFCQVFSSSHDEPTMFVQNMDVVFDEEPKDEGQRHEVYNNVDENEISGSSAPVESEFTSHPSMYDGLSFNSTPHSFRSAGVVTKNSLDGIQRDESCNTQSNDNLSMILTSIFNKFVQQKNDVNIECQGNQSHGNQSQDNQSHGNQSHGNQSHGNQMRDNQSHGDQRQDNQVQDNQSQENQISMSTTLSSTGLSYDLSINGVDESSQVSLN